MQRRVLLNAAVGSFVSALSTSIVGVVLPQIRAWAGVEVIAVQWVMLMPLVVVSAVLLPAGRAGDLFGHRRSYLFGLAVLVVGSVVSVVAPGFASLLCGRAIQGFGSAMLMVSSPALVSLASPPEHRGRALGLISSSLYVGLTAGPPIGGFLTSLAGWKAVFVVQLVLAAALFALTWTLMPEVNKGGSDRNLDLPGTGLLATALCCLLLAVTRAEVWGGTATVALAVPGAVLLAGFLAWEARNRQPLLDLALFRNRTFASAAAGAFLNYAGFTHATFLLPFYLEEILGYSTSHAGVFLMAMPLLMALAASPSGHLSDRLGSRWLSSTGLAVSACALALLTRVSPTSSPSWLLVFLALLGFGTGIFISPNTNALMSSSPRDRQGTAGGTMSLARNLGMVTGTALSAGVFASVRAKGIAAGLSSVPASMLGLHTAYWIGAAIAFAGTLVVLVRPKQTSPSGRPPRPVQSAAPVPTA
jgi:EmrB/QacA subfamily drug resistance transporter